MVKDLGMQNLFSSIGISYEDQNRIDNLNYNFQYDVLIDEWQNGAPYTCFTSTRSLPNQTTVHTGHAARRIRVTHLLETSYAAATEYFWKIPLLLNPAV